MHSVDLSGARRNPLFARIGQRSFARVETKTTAYFDAICQRPDRAINKDEWIERVVTSPLRQVIQADGRIKRWAPIPEMDNRVLRVILLSDGATVHNAFFDRPFPS